MLQYSNAVFCEKLKKARKARNLTQVQASELLGIKRNTYARYETGHAEPCHAVLFNISKLYKISIDDLLDPDPEKLKFKK